MKNILLSVGFSEHAYNAAIYAAELAMQTKTRLILFHAFNPVPPAEDGGAFETERKIQIKLDNLTLKLKALTDISITRLLKPGQFADETLYVANKIKADLILISAAKITQNQYPDEQISKLIQRAEIPVMIIPATAAFKPYQQVLLNTVNEGTEHDTAVFRCLNKIFFSFSELELVKLQALIEEPETMPAEVAVTGAGNDASFTDFLTNPVAPLKPLHPQLIIARGITNENNFTDSRTIAQVLTKAIPLLLLPGT